MKKKPLAPRAQILWFPVLHQLSIPGLSPSHNSLRDRGPSWPGRGGLCRGAPGRHFPMCQLRIRGCGARRARPAAPHPHAPGRAGSGPSDRGSAPGAPESVRAAGARHSPSQHRPEAGCSPAMRERGSGVRPRLGRCTPASLTHPEPAAVVALMELMRSRLAVSFSACSVCWSGLW